MCDVRIGRGNPGRITGCRAAEDGQQHFLVEAPIFSQYDAILTPGAQGEPSDDLTGIQKSSFNRIRTMLHGLAITIPVYSGPNGLPVGVQLVGPVGADDRLTQISDWVWRAIKNC